MGLLEDIERAANERLAVLFPGHPKIATEATADIRANPLGGVLLGGELIYGFIAAPATGMPSPIGIAVPLGAAAWLGSAATDQVGLTKGAHQQVVDAEAWILTHPTEAEELLKGGELLALPLVAGGGIPAGVAAMLFPAATMAGGWLIKDAQGRFVPAPNNPAVAEATPTPDTTPALPVVDDEPEEPEGMPLGMLVALVGLVLILVLVSQARE